MCDIARVQCEVGRVDATGCNRAANSVRNTAKTASQRVKSHGDAADIKEQIAASKAIAARSTRD